LAKSGREEILSALAKAGMNAVALGIEESKYGAVETTKKPSAARNFSANTKKRLTV